MVKETCSLLIKRVLKNIKMYAIWMAVAIYMTEDKEAFGYMDSAFAFKIKLSNG